MTPKGMWIFKNEIKHSVSNWICCIFYSTAVMVFQGLGDVRSSTMERLQREYGNESMTQAARRADATGFFGMK